MLSPVFMRFPALGLVSFVVSAFATAGQTPAPATKGSTSPVPGEIRKTSMGMEMAWVPLGGFLMGSSEADITRTLKIAAAEKADVKRSELAHEKPQRKVTIPHGFWMGRFEVTQGQWQQVMGDNPSFYIECGKDCPVEKVSWEKVQLFIEELNKRNDGYVYSLPSEAEWEYAARAGSKGLFGGTGRVDEMGWHRGNSRSGGYPGGTHPVGQKRPNGWGLYDMHGNVWEWVQDFYGGHSTAPSDGSANLHQGDKRFRVWRGGSIAYLSYHARSASRLYSPATFRLNVLGFRIVARESDQK